MTFFGPTVLDSEIGSLEYSVLVAQIVRRLEENLSKVIASQRIDNAVSGDLRALRALCELHPRAGGEGVSKKAVAEWRESFLPWFEKHSSKIPKQLREALIQQTRSDLDYLSSVAYGIRSRS